MRCDAMRCDVMCCVHTHLSDLLNTVRVEIGRSWLILEDCDGDVVVGPFHQKRRPEIDEILLLARSQSARQRLKL